MANSNKTLVIACLTLLIAFVFMLGRRSTKCTEGTEGTKGTKGTTVRRGIEQVAAWETEENNSIIEQNRTGEEKVEEDENNGMIEQYRIGKERMKRE
jgi:hypothetical protein